MKKIAIQGIKGCFHHVSLIKFFWRNGYEIVECKSFNQLTQAVTNGEANFGIMAIENSIIGSLLSNYIFLSNHHLKILSSIALYIEQHIMTFTGTGKEFNMLLSHRIALQQCNDFISEYTQLRTIEYSDTALASLYISKNRVKKKASIASILASKEYGLEIIYKNIQSISNNFTLFLIIGGSQRKIKENWNKSSIRFCLKANCHNKFLSLLNTIANKKINFTKILSFKDRPGEYVFYIDIILDDYMVYEHMKSKIKNKSHIFSIIGEYINFIYV